MLAEDREEVKGVVFDDFRDDHCLNHCSGRQTKCGDLSMNKLTDVHIVPALSAVMVSSMSDWSFELTAASAPTIISSNSIPEEVIHVKVKGPETSVFVVACTFQCPALQGQL